MRRLADDILQACRADPTRDAPARTRPDRRNRSGDRRHLSDDDICNDMLIFMLAGHDTTATVLTYALWALGRHPAVQYRVAAEVAEIGDRELTPDDVPRLGYTVQVLHEALRLCSARGRGRAPGVCDIAVDGYRVAAGSVVAVGIHAVHRDAALWSHPLEFDPDRFGPEASAVRNRWQFVPFAAGSRSCIGEHFARLETTLALATIIRSIEVRSLAADFPVEVPYTTVAKGPIPASVLARTPRPHRPTTPCS